MADVLGKKISELAETTDLAGLYTIGSDRNNQSKKVPLQFVKEAADYANAQGDYAKGVGDTIQGNTGVNEYPAFSSSTQYAAGSVVRYNDKLYRFTALHPAGAWVGTDAIETSIKAETDVKLTELESKNGRAVCGTALSEPNKVVYLPGYVPDDKTLLYVYFGGGNTADNVTLNINNTGAKTLYYNGKLVNATTNNFQAGYLLVLFASDLDSYISFQLPLISQQEGGGLINVMSQKAVTDSLNQLRNSPLRFRYEDVFLKGAPIVPITGIYRNIVNGNARRVGDIYYNPETNKLRRIVSITSVNTATLEDYEFVEGAYYLNLSNSILYIHDGNTMIPQIEDSIYFNSRRIFYLKGFDGMSSDATDKGSPNYQKVGDMYYDSANKVMKVAIYVDSDKSDWRYIDIPPMFNAIYIYGREMYIWDGEDLVSIEQGSKPIVQESKTCIIDVSLEKGQLGTTDGANYAPSSGDGSPYLGFISRFISCEGAISINTEIPSESTDLYIFRYDDDFVFLNYKKISVSDTTYQFVPDSPYFRLVFSGNFTYKNARIKVSGQMNTGELKEVKLGHEAGKDFIFFRYTLDEPVTNDDISPSLEYQGNGNSLNIWNKGFISLPDNYSREGEPVPLVLFCHGTGGFKMSETSPIYYADYIKYVTANGYAVCDCCALTSAFASISEKTDGDAAQHTPLYLSAVVNLYKYLMRNYNLRQDGIYVYGKSAGGMMALTLAQLDVLPVRCAAGLAPSVDIFADMRVMNAVPTTLWFELLGLTPPKLNGYNFTGDEQQWILSNISRFIGWNPMWYNSINLNIPALLSEMLATDNTTSGIEGNAKITELTDAAQIILKKPYKIWQAVDDANVPIATSRLYHKMCRNANSPCYLRELPSGCGQHKAVDRAENAPRVDYQTKYGGIINMPIAYAEMLDWFERW